MVAYSFHKYFVSALLAGRKTQTIRGDRMRGHVRPGGQMQIFTGMRTRHCRKVIKDVTCTEVQPIRLGFQRAVIVQVKSEEVEISEAADLDRFAIADGFDGILEMSKWWVQHSAVKVQLKENDWTWTGVLITW